MSNRKKRAHRAEALNTDAKEGVICEGREALCELSPTVDELISLSYQVAKGVYLGEVKVKEGIAVALNMANAARFVYLRDYLVSSKSERSLIDA